MFYVNRLGLSFFLEANTINKYMKTHHTTTNFPGSSDDSVAVARRLLAELYIEPPQYDEKLLYACSRGRLELARLLLTAGVDVNAKDTFGWTPLHQAAWEGHTDVVPLLPAAGAEVDAKNESGSTPLHLAAAQGHTDVARLLLAAGADVDAKNTNGSTPLHRAAYQGHTEAVRLLPEAGADVDAKDKDGLTPLHRAAGRAAGRENPDVVRLLLEAGADANGTSRWKLTPLDFAIDLGKTECMGVLRKFGGKRSWKSIFLRLIICLMVPLAGGGSATFSILSRNLLMSYDIRLEMTPIAC